MISLGIGYGGTRHDTPFASRSYGQAPFPSVLDNNTFALGDAAPGASNGGSWGGGASGLVAGGVITDNAGASMNARWQFSAASVLGTTAQPGNLYGFAVDVLSFEDLTPGAPVPRLELILRGGTQVLHTGGWGVTGVMTASFIPELSDADGKTFFDVYTDGGISFELDNVRLWDMTARLDAADAIQRNE